MTYASRAASFSGRTSRAAADKRLLAFRPRKRTAQSVSCKSVSHESQNLVETRLEGQRMEAFQEMFLKSRPKFINMAQAILRNKEDAEDAVQNAFLSGYLHLPGFEGRSALTTWFTRIVFNAALMIRRKRKPSCVSPLPQTSTAHDTAWMERIPASQADPEVVCSQRETFQLISRMLGKMRPALRQALTMTYYDELSGPEACARLGVSAGTFKARLFRAKQQLLKQAGRTLKAPIRKATPCTFFPDKNGFEPLALRPAENSPVEVSFS